MFKKPFKIKSNTQLKSTDRKTLKETFLKTFPILTEDDINSILPKKEVAFCMKLLTSDNTSVLVYLIQKRAIAFEVNGILYPSIYLLWRYENLIVNFTTNSFVISKLVGGADLMLPGVLINPNGYGVFSEKSAAGINSNSNKAIIAIGITAISSHDLELDKCKGKCVIIYHYLGDKLCSLEDMPVLPLPNLGPPEWLNYSIDSATDFPPLGGGKVKEEVKDIILAVDENKNDEVKTPNDVDKLDDANEDNTCTIDIVEVHQVGEMDKILTNSFLTAIKYSKTLQLPMLTSTFYKLEVMPLCPTNINFDIKKTTYKKVGQFLKHMHKEGVVVIKEKKKGVETLEAINREHTMLMNFYVDLDSRPKKAVEENSSNTVSPPVIIENYVITKTVLPIFVEFGLKKGDTVLGTDVRKYVTSFVKHHDCQNKENARLVDVSNPALAPLCKNENAVSWEELMEKIFAAMKSCYKVTSGYEETVNKGKLQPIMMVVQTRSGNKKVTLVDNLELYGIRMSEFAKECQHGVAASTSVTTKPPGKKSDQLLVQGNQILFVYNILVEKYKIPKKYIRGLEFAPKKK